MKWFLFSFLLILNGCSGLPKAMQGKAYSRLNLTTIKQDISAYKNTSFRWGGTIINVVNEKDSSQINLLYYPLSRYGRPLIERKTEGRFAITSPLFLDPAVYKEGMEVTVTGKLTGHVKQQIGKKALLLPLLSADNIHIWPVLDQQNDQIYPYLYSPFYPYSHPFYRHNSHYPYYY